MSGKRLCIAVLFAVTVAASAAAQEKNELSGSFIKAFISTQPFPAAACGSCFDPNIRYGKGWSVEGSYARRLLVNPIFSIAAEVPIVFNPDEDLHAGGQSLVPKDYKALFMAPSVRANLFPTTAVSLWGSIGGGVAHFGQNPLTLYGAPNTGKNTFAGVLQYGVGLDVKLAKHLVLRGEARDFWAGVPDFPQAPPTKTRQHNYFIGAGVVWRF
jgi:hypothetical protein